MPVAIEMALLLLLLGGFWVQEVITESQTAMETLQTPTSLDNVSSIPVTLNLNSMTSDAMKISSTGDQPPSSTSSIANEKVTSFGTSTGVNTVPPALELTTFQEVSTKNLLMLMETSNATSDPVIPLKINSLESHTRSSRTITSSLETSSVTSGPPVTKATSSLETSSVTSGLPVTEATSSLETSSVTSGLPVTEATSSLETSSVTSGLPVTEATSSLETSSVTSGPPVTEATSSLETSGVTSGPPVTEATSSLETSSLKISTMITSETSKNTITEFSSHSEQGRGGNLLVVVLVILLVVAVLVALLVLWCRRQKHRTGALTLSTGGKHNKMVDAWAGPAQVPDEEVVTETVGGSGSDKGSGAPDREGSGRRSTLTTFFGRRKSRQGSLALEELEIGSAPSSKGEEEPLVDSKAGAVEAPTSDGPEVRDGNASQCL
ncbi:leukosialin [Trichechus inunguis]